MKSWTLFLVVAIEALISISSGVSAETATETVGRIQGDFAALAKMLKSGSVDCYEVCYIPVEREFPVGLNARSVKEGYNYKLTVRDCKGGKKVLSLCRALETTRVSFAEDGPDARWGVFFYVNEKVVLDVYMDPTGTRAIVNGKSVGLNNPLINWLKKNVLPCFSGN